MSNQTNPRPKKVPKEIVTRSPLAPRVKILESTEVGRVHRTATNIISMEGKFYAYAFYSHIDALYEHSKVIDCMHSAYTMSSSQISELYGQKSPDSKIGAPMRTDTW